MLRSHTSLSQKVCRDLAVLVSPERNNNHSHTNSFLEKFQEEEKTSDSGHFRDGPNLSS